MYSARIENNKGESLNLSQNKNYALFSIDGLTPPKATLNFSSIATADGSIFNSAKLGNRNIVFTIAPIYEIEKSRINLYKFFRIKQICKFYFNNGSREVCIEGRVEAIDGDLFENNQNLQISIICPQPYFKALDESIKDISQIVPMFEFPFSIVAAGVTFSKIEKVTEINVYNSGDVESGLTIELRAVGPVSNPAIYDEAGNTFELDIDMIAGDIITINTNTGEKSVTLFRDGFETNIINLVQPNPKWFTLEPGDNVFLYSATNLDLLQMLFKHYSLYEGI